MTRESNCPARVLLVEDDFLVAADISDQIMDTGMELAGLATTVDAALEAVSGELPFDLAILDINLAGETVYPVADELVARNLPFIFLTGYERGFIPPSHSAVPRFSKPLTRSAVQEMLHYLDQSARRSVRNVFFLETGAKTSPRDSLLYLSSSGNEVQLPNVCV